MFSEVHRPASLTSTVLRQLQAPAPPHPHPQACPSIGQAVGYSEPGFVPVSCWPPCQPGAGAGTDLIWQLRKRVVGTGWGDGGGGQDTHPRKEINSLRQALSRMGRHSLAQRRAEFPAWHSLRPTQAPGTCLWLQDLWLSGLWGRWW